MTTTITKNGGIMSIESDLLDVFVNDGWKVVGDTPSTTSQNDDTEVETEKTTISLSKDKKRLKSRFEK